MTDGAATISATAEARAALAIIVKEHGPVMFHTTGGRVGGRRYPVCMPAGTLRLGSRDHLLGEVEGAPIYAMEDRDGELPVSSAGYILDVEAGPALGFSIIAAPGKRFSLVARAGGACSNC